MRVHHIALRTRDLAALVDFYRRWLGVSVLRDQRPRSVWLDLAGEAVLMIEAADEAEPRPPAGGLDLLAFRLPAADFEATRLRLEGAGLLESRTEQTLYFRDPDGRRLGLSCFPLRA